MELVALRDCAAKAFAEAEVPNRCMGSRFRFAVLMF
jgi:hypothetical protein